MMGDGMLSLSWNNHSTTFCHMLSALRLKERYTDATVACEGKFYPVHKLVLSTCSQYFEEMFEHTAGKHPVVLLQDVRRDELEALLSYMYAGIVSVAQRDLSRLIKVAELLQIKGLAVPDEIPAEKRSKASIGLSSSAEKASSKSQACDASDDRSSPHPKRRRRGDSEESLQGRSESPNTLYNPVSQDCYKADYHTQEPAVEEATHRLEEASSDPCDGDMEEHDKKGHSEKAKHIENSQSSDRYQTHTQDSSRSQYKDGGEEAIVIKEETWEDASEQPSSNSLGGGMEYCGGLPADAPAEGSTQEDKGRLMMPAKDYEDQSHQTQLPPQALPEVVVEALAGPSGMHEWLGGSEFSGGVATSDSYGGEGSPPQNPVAGVEGDTQREGGAGTGERSVREVHQCPCCSYITPRKDHMKEHIRTHTGEKPFSCPHCPYRTAKNSDIHRHMQTHTGEKPFACSQCPFRTSRRVNLKNHLRTHSDGSSSKEFACPTCDYRCSRQWALTRHLQTHAHTCPYCQVCFPRKSQLTVHLQSHI
ncbi:zinc finger and BTB domain-containing protein 7A-like isoform X2 [Portunus trituberculatus]|uniref:zinc finger and BTB domain-containing protein 7A-like isoform X2 n=1 Tax=Portunus trituberculatus TaxID=210409 RepID=UPI001E1D0105|nr:zinc finger and BTB domain-containing protein 7A-like isoform X2 [Portunus trituberculatus]